MGSQHCPENNPMSNKHYYVDVIIAEAKDFWLYLFLYPWNYILLFMTVYILFEKRLKCFFFFLHSSWIYAVSPVWVCICVFKYLICGNPASHSPHVNNFSSVWEWTWFLRFYYVKILHHISKKNWFLPSTSVKYVYAIVFFLKL